MRGADAPETTRTSLSSPAPSQQPARRPCTPEGPRVNAARGVGAGRARPRRRRGRRAAPAGRRREHLQAALRERRPARQGRRRAGRRPAHRLDPQDRRSPTTTRPRSRSRCRTATPRCTRARRRSIRATSLSGIANRYIALTPGPNSNPKLPDGATLGTDKTTSIVDLDQLFNTLRPQDARGAAAGHPGQRAVVRQPRHAGQRGDEVLQPRAERLAPAGQRGRRQPADAQRLPAQRGQDDGRPRLAPRRPREPRLQREHDRGRDRRRERVVQPGAGAAARHAAQGQHDVRQPARDAGRPRRARGRVQAGDEGPRPFPERAAPARAGSAPDDLRPQHARPSQRPRTTTSPTCSARRRRSRRPPSRRSRTRSRRCSRPRRSSSSSGPTRRTSSAGCATSAWAAANYDANGHFARISPIFNAYSFNQNTSQLTPIPPSQRLAGLQTGQVRRCPGAASQAPVDGSAPFRDTDGSLDCDPSLVPPGP